MTLLQPSPAQIPPAQQIPPIPDIPPVPDVPTPVQGSEPRWMINGKEVREVEWKGGSIQFTYADGSMQAIPIREAVPSGAVDILQSFFLMIVVIVVGRPISRAIARWIDRRSAQPHVPREVNARMQRMEETLDNVALEVERIGEGQRFTSRLLADEHSEAETVVRGGHL